MLVAIGNGVNSLQDYTNFTYQESIDITHQQGDTLPTAKLQILDAKNIFPITTEDDLIILDENDTNGWPSMNMAQNPSFTSSYSGGVAGSWTATAVTGVTYSSFTTNNPFGGTPQRIQATNSTNGSVFGISQVITLPLNENQVLINANNFTFSAYCLFRSSSVAMSSFVRIDWFDSTNTFISFVSTNTLPQLLGGIGIWQQVFVKGLAPSNAVTAKISINGQAVSGTNSLDLLIAGAQFEYDTFANVKSMSYPMPLLNQTLVCTNNPGIPDYWSSKTASWISWGAATYPVLTPTTNPLLPPPTSERLVVTNQPQGPSGDAFLIQGPIAFNPYTVYTISFTVWLPSAMTTGLNFFTNLGYGNLGFINGNIKTIFQQNNVPFNSWTTLSVRVGPGTGNVAPANSTQLTISFGITNQSAGATNLGTVFIGGSQVAADVATSQVAQSATSAEVAGIYPTPLIYINSIIGPNGNAIAAGGVNVDNGYSNLPYRHNRLFGGYIRIAGYDYSHSPERTIDINATGYGILLQETPANIIIRNQQDTVAIADAMVYGLSQGFLKGINYTTYVTPLQVIDNLTFNWQTTKDVLSQISNLTVADYWVDDYKFLHYQAQQATPSQYGLSDTPNLTTTFPMVGFRYDNDSTQSVTEKVFEGGNVVSLPVSQTFHGLSTNLTSNLVQGTTYTSISVTATTTSVQAGTIVQLDSGASVTVNTAAISGATTLLINSFTADQNYSGSTVIAVAYLVNGGSPIYQVTAMTVNAVAQTVGVNGVNTYSQGYTALADTGGSIVYLQTAPGNGQAVVITYTYQAPVIVRLRNGGAETAFGTIRRRIHHHQQDSTITSITTAISRSSSELAQYSKSRPIGRVTVYSPPWPTGVHIMAGQAIPITYSAAGLIGTLSTSTASSQTSLTNSLFQCQTVNIKQIGPGKLVYTADIGYYRPDLAVLLQQGRVSQVSATDVQQGSTISDVLATSDGWAMTDNILPVIGNVGVWGNPTPSTWGGIFVWG